MGKNQYLDIIRKKIYKVNLTILLLSLISCSWSSNNNDKIEGKYVGFFYESNFEYEFLKDKFKFTSRGHYGSVEVKGKFEIVTDQLILHPNYPNEQIMRDEVIIERFNIDRINNCLVSLKNQAYCKGYEQSMILTWELRNLSD